MSFKKRIRRFFLRLRGCKHRLMPYQCHLEVSNKRKGLTMVQTWKCTKCGKVVVGKSIKEKGGTLK